MLSGRMILPRLHRRSRSSRKPLQQQAEVVQQLSTQEMNLRGLVQRQCSLHHHQDQHLQGMFKVQLLSILQQLLPQLQAIHLVHQSRPYQSQSQKWRVRRPTSILYLNQLSRVRPTSKSDIRHFHMINRLHRQCLWHHLPQLICRG